MNIQFQDQQVTKEHPGMKAKTVCKIEQFHSDAIVSLVLAIILLIQAQFVFLVHPSSPKTMNGCATAAVLLALASAWFAFTRGKLGLYGYSFVLLGAGFTVYSDMMLALQSVLPPP